jgi:hypothetical protein
MILMFAFVRKGPLYLVLFILTLLILLAVACSSDKENQKEPETTNQPPEPQEPVISDANLGQPGYGGWKVYNDEFLTVYAPPDSALLERVPAIAQRIKQVFAENSYRLKVQIPMPDTFYLYNNTTEIEERTDCNNTCVEGNTVHYMIFTPLGIPVMTRLLTEFDPDGTPYKFCREGLITLLDYSGKNYVEEAYIDYFNDKGVALDSLLDNKKYMALDSVRRTKAAASFIQFLIDKPWSPDSVLALYKHTDAPQKALEEIFGRPVSQLQQDWYAYLKKNSGLDMEQQYGR